MRTNSSGSTITAASVQLNDYYSLTYSEHRNVSCHETGHAIGLGHNTSTSSCMHESDVSSRYPNQDDYALIDANY